MTKLELVLAHQATLQYIHTNQMSCSPRDLAKSADTFLHPSTPWGLCLLRTISRNVGRAINDQDAIEIARYL